MTTMPLLAGFLLVLISGGLLLAFTVTQRKAGVRRLRSLPPVDALRKAVGLSVEDGRRLHIALGSAHLLSPQNASSLVGLSTLERLSQASMLSDRPPTATSGDGSLSILSQDTLRYVYRSGNVLDQYNPDQAHLSGVTPFTYAAGAYPMSKDAQTSVNLLVGNYGPESALLCEAGERPGGFTFGASDSLEAQAVLYASAQETLVGEEVFALPAYINPAPVYSAGIRVQDVLRWILIGIILIGSVLKLVGSLTGIPIL